MNIPIDGSITKFQQKIAAKGWRYDSDSKTLAKGIRMYNGTFAGQKAQLCVYFDEVTSEVWKCLVMFPETSSLETARGEFERKKQILKNKYSDISVTCEMLDDGCEPDKYVMYLFQPPIEEESKPYGAVVIHVEEYQYDYLPSDYSVWIEYEDAQNSVKYFNRIEEDY